jgi:hypothetical protein
VIEVAEEHVEAVYGRQEFVAVAEMVLAELSGRVALWLEQLGNGRVFLRQPLLGGWQADFQQPRAQRALPGDERGAAGGARLLAVIVGEDRALGGDAVDVGRAIAHHATVVGADVPVADIVTHDDEDVGLLLLLLRRRGYWCDQCESERCQQGKPDVPAPVHRRSPDEVVARSAYGPRTPRGAPASPASIRATGSGASVPS